MIHVDFSEGHAELKVEGNGDFLTRELALVVHVIVKEAEGVTAEDVLERIRTHILDMKKIDDESME